MGIHCGVDIVEIERIRKSIEQLGQAFIERVFTPSEIAFCEARKAVRFNSYAARFAAKEAVSKAFGTGIAEGLSWKDIEVLNDSLGKPYVVLRGNGLRLFEAMKGIEIALSLSHSDNYAVASVVLQTRCPD